MTILETLSDFVPGKNLIWKRLTDSLKFEKKNHTHYTSRYFSLPLLCPPKNKKYVSLLAVLTPETTKKAFIRLGFLLIVQLLEIAVSLWQLTVFLYN